MPVAEPMHALRDPRSVDELFLYRLTRLAAIARLPVVRLCEREHGITRREWRVLGLLAQHGGVNPSVLAEHALLDRARTSRAVSSLVGKGLVMRTPAPADRREVLLHLTDAGRSAYAQLMPLIAGINRDLLAVLDDADVAALDHALVRLTARAEALARRQTGPDAQNGMSSSMSSNPVDDF